MRPQRSDRARAKFFKSFIPILTDSMGSLKPQPKFGQRTPLLTKKRLLFIAIFTIIAFFAAQINFSSIVGADKQYFTFFQFLGPVAGAFLGPLFGAASVLLAELINFVLLGKEIELINLLRLTPMLFAACYFGAFAGKRESLLRSPAVVAAVPVLCMLAFWLHPTGAGAWAYPFYWLIPAISLLFPKRLFMRSLGATFTAHAIGSTLWLYTVPMPAEAWLALIPIVAYERLAFAAGISVGYIALNAVLSRLTAAVPDSILHIDSAYLPRKLLLRA